ncbi:cytochrome P450 [Nitzschia inconspicua]|uniref:Cytochrome P450 n=1 Tax=Nitzschia inconspicua TaxID=303405 RepID=A0A9K3PQZ8_9STRA|nr:cytochrome P450 [Nitzschia inconspicua]
MNKNSDLYVADTSAMWNETLVAAAATEKPTPKRRPKPLPFVSGIKYLLEVARGTVHKYQYRLAKEHGDAFIIWNKYVTITNADAIRDILYVYNLEKSPDANNAFKVMFFPTGGILGAPWKEWVQQRRMTAPALSENVVGALAPKFEEAAQPFFEILEQAAKTKEVLEMDYVFTCLTMDTIGLILLGRTFGLLERIRDKQSKKVPFQEALDIMAQHAVDEAVYGFLPPWLNKTIRKTPEKVLWAKKILNLFLDDCIEQRLSIGADSQKDTNLLNILLEAEQEGIITREELKAQLLVFVFAGYDTTAHTLSFMLYEVASNPDLQKELFLEAKEVLPSFSSFPREQKVLSDGLPLLDRVWLETLRYHPATASGATRVVGEDPIIVGDGLELPAKCFITIPFYAFQRNPAYWENPETFDPSRWEPGKMKVRDPITLMTFSAGPRNCLGARLARAEALSVMATLLRRFNFTCLETSEPETFQSLTTRPRDGIRFTFQSNVSDEDEPLLKSLYAKARSLTIDNNSVTLFQECLKRNPTDRTAATWIAAETASPKRHDVLGRGGDLLQRRKLIDYLKSIDFNNSSIVGLLFSKNHAQATKARASSAPLYLQPLRPGMPPPAPPCDPLSACIQLFVLACCLPLDLSIHLFGKQVIDLMQIVGVAFPSSDGSLLIPYCHITPVSVRDKTLYVATDLHPTVLLSTTIGSQIHDSTDDNGAVMYISPDSIGLVDHWCSLQKPVGDDVIVDVGCGSGIQALCIASLAAGAKVKCIDINKRALRITQLNFEWNGPDAPNLIQGDIMTTYGHRFFPENEHVGEETPWKELLGEATMMVSNPPFLPVPVNDLAISKRHGWFSSGGSSGEEFLESLVKLASTALDGKKDSTVAIVSEFMNPGNDFAIRVAQWWGQGRPGRVLLFTNQVPLDAESYASRRASGTAEAWTWKKHLDSQGIQDVSPGFLFLKQSPLNSNNQSTQIEFSHYLVPKTESGSIWTPTNLASRQFTKRLLTIAGFIE